MWKVEKKNHFLFSNQATVKALGVVRCCTGGAATPSCLQADQWRRMGLFLFFSTGGGNRLKNKKIIINKLIIYFCLVGCGASVRLRVGPLWRSGRIATTVDVEQPIAGRFRTVAVGRPQTGQLDDPRTVLHRPLPLLTGQYFRIPGT